MTKTYDALIIGSGTAGQSAAFELKKAGLDVGLAEKSSEPGGTCALRGCQAKKWYYEGAEVVARSRHLSGMGIKTEARGDWSQLKNEKNKFTSKVPGKTVEGLEKAGIDCLFGVARFTDEHTVFVDNRQVSARFILIATGAEPISLPIDGAEHMINSTRFLDLETLPRHILFVGGGFIAFEFAHFAVRLGEPGTRCTILEAKSRPLGPFDAEMVGLLSEASAAEGIDIHCNSTITSIKKEKGIFTVTTEEGHRFEADLVVNGAGRVPAIGDLELAKGGIEYTKKGITVDKNMTTSNPDVFALGDCAATVMLARVADAEAKTAVDTVLNRLNKNHRVSAMDYTAIPSLLFTYPQYGMVGVTEKTLEEKGISYEKSFGKELSWPTYRRVGLRSAAYKILVGEAETILGAHILSDNAAGLINAIALAMANRISVEDLYRQSILTPYPSRESDLIYMLNSFIRRYS